MSVRRNLGIDFDVCRLMFEGVSINFPAMKNTIPHQLGRRENDVLDQIDSLLRAVSCIDLTCLCKDYSEWSDQRLCSRAENPIEPNLLKTLEVNPEKFHVRAVCVYPARVKDCVKTLKDLKSSVPVASVVAGFPSAYSLLDTKLCEIECCIQDGAKEIDVVISHNLVLDGELEELYNEVKAMKEACGSEITMKTIILAGELGSLENIYKASIVCMAAGSDFLKEATGTESVIASLVIGRTMARAIKAYYDKTGFEVGFAPAEGIRTADEILWWQTMIRKELGFKWFYPHLFRIGASGHLSDAVEQNIILKLCENIPPEYIFAYQ